MSSQAPQGKISIVVPVFNKKDDIGVMLESVYSQVWDNIELIFVNDGATDGTREILGQWEPKLIERGYSVLIIDQENQGISAAVRNGMLRMSGDYFCSVDCDDYLYPEYVSTMASWLDEHPEYDYTACGFERVRGTRDDWVIKTIDVEENESLSAPHLAERILLGQMEIVTWIYLVRRAYLDKCKVIENFVTEPRLHQEPSIAIPLALGGGKIKYFPKVLLRHFMFDRRTDLEGWNERFPGYPEIRTHILRTVIEAFPMQDEPRESRLLHICEFVKARHKYRNGDSREYNIKTTIAEELANLTNRCFEPSPGVSAGEIINTGFRLFFFAFEECILKEKVCIIKDRLESIRHKRIIYYGVLGKEAKKNIPLLAKTDLKPDALWDAAAARETISGIVVDKPDYSILNGDDIVILLPRSISIAEQVMPSLTDAGVKHIVNHADMIKYLAESYYARLYKPCCRFI